MNKVLKHIEEYNQKKKNQEFIIEYNGFNSLDHKS